MTGAVELLAVGEDAGLGRHIQPERERLCREEHLPETDTGLLDRPRAMRA